MNAIAIDDESLALDVIEHLCNKEDRVKLLNKFQVIKEAEKFLRKFPVDIVFLDINMPSISGIEFSKSLPKHCLIIFTTAYSEYAVDGFNADAIDYLLKPISESRFKRAIDKAEILYRARIGVEDDSSKYLYVRADLALHKLEVENILAIEGISDYVKIVMMDKSSIVARMTMKDALEKLPKSNFMRVNRSFIINTDKLEKMIGRKLLVAGREYAIGNTYYPIVKEKFKI